ncbi:GH22033, related [Neospora caninum Liverpool]|uniref:GH22033, related n=1 Tax=Neospora caninum (strain Liverpool) TaxID=572307 RepID=F0VDQ0_NEOCL|nr:GH22033, related [Neospora caninum Liverpool]CBZ51843.1 GH22033, related [Neospora caninum Liverpool]|eukprot:XP_003881876.1 GH22033, related [Neospora caninum Liverpool]
MQFWLAAQLKRSFGLVQCNMPFFKFPGTTRPKRTVRLWRVNDQKSLKNGSRARIYWPIKDQGLQDTGVNASRAYNVNSCYKGEWRDNKRHGFGIQTYGDGSTYEGQWCEDRRHGEGIMWEKLPTSDLYRRAYCGQWQRDKQWGEGEALEADGGRYAYFDRNAAFSTTLASGGKVQPSRRREKTFCKEGDTDDSGATEQSNALLRDKTIHSTSCTLCAHGCILFIQTNSNLQTPVRVPPVDHVEGRKPGL